MRQVPYYLIIGDGRMARHMACYFDFLSLSYHTWARRSHDISQLPDLISKSTHVLILISDNAIDDFICTHLAGTDKTLVHFSGSLNTTLAHMAHPLMSFTPSVYTHDIYQSIWFVIEQEGPEFSSLLPGVPNAHAAIPTKDKNFYHSLCVLSSNFTCLLWQKLFTTLEQQWQIPSVAAQPILKQVMANLIHNPQSALTGPLARDDQQTIQRNLQALENDAYQEVYQAFVNAYQQERK
ncbi:MAG: DUF2520 domain-containing protein [Legionellales bacterium]|jgi:predicted short-subunit dehydrogenase-like oxidoreductase (DUF2520 family)